VARHPRYAVAGLPQHVIQRGNNRAPIFVQPTDYERFRRYLRDACERSGCRVHAYVLMTNHVHLLVTPRRPEAIAAAMQSVGRRYVQHFNRWRGRTGTLWEGRYKAAVIETDEYLLACYRYIERNPVRAGMVATPEAYPWSSYGANAFGRPDPLVTPHRLYVRLGETDGARRAAYRALCAVELEVPAANALRRAAETGWALGGRRFLAAVERTAGRRAAPLPRGRRRGSSGAGPSAD
jgi:putative transposase